MVVEGAGAATVENALSVLRQILELAKKKGSLGILASV
jgi:hypothetical protein